MPTDVHKIFGIVPRWLAVWGFAIPLLTLVIIAAGSWWITVPVVISAPMLLTQQTNMTESPLIGTLHIAYQDAKQIMLGQSVEIALDDDPGTIRGVVYTIKSTDQLAAEAHSVSPSLTDRRSYRLALLNRMHPKIASRDPRSQVYTVAVTFPDGLRTSSGKLVQVHPNMQGTARIVIGKQRLWQRFWELFHRKE
jgi:hypothetical protein